MLECCQCCKRIDFLTKAIIIRSFLYQIVYNGDLCMNRS